MGGLSDEERVARFESDCAIINRIADGKIARLKDLYEGFDKKEQAEVDKKIAAKEGHRGKRKAWIKEEWDRILAAVRPGQEWKKRAIDELYDGLSNLADLEFEDWFNHAAEVQYKKDQRQEERRRKELDIIEIRRFEDLERERLQLQAHTQRQRR